MNKRIKIVFFSLLAVGFISFACQQLTKYYFINEDKCTSCMKCVSVCGYGAISFDSIYRTTSEDYEYETTIRIDPKKCVGCGECFKNCSSNAISASISEVDGISGATARNNDD